MPGVGGGMRIGPQAHAQRLPVPPIAPVGHQQAQRLLPAAFGGESNHIAGGILHPRAVHLPGAGAGAYDERKARGDDLAAARNARALGLVVPVQHDHVLREFRQHLRVLQDNVRPQVQTLAVPVALGVKLADETGVNFPHAHPRGRAGAAALAEFPRLIPAGVEIVGRKDREKLFIEFRHQPDGTGVQRAKRGPAGEPVGARSLGQVAIGGQSQDAFHVAETGQ